MLLHVMCCAYYAICSARPPAATLVSSESAAVGGTRWVEVLRPLQPTDDPRLLEAAADAADDAIGDGGSGEMGALADVHADFRPIGGLNLYVCALYQTLCLFFGEAVLADDAPTGQRLGGMLLMIVGMLVIAQLIADVNAFATAASMSRVRFQKRLNLVTEKMEFYRLPPEVQMRVRLRYNYAWRKYRDMQATDFLTSLSPPMSKDIATTLYLVSPQGPERHIAAGGRTPTSPQGAGTPVVSAASQRAGRGASD